MPFMSKTLLLIIFVGGFFFLWRHPELRQEIRISVADTLDSAAEMMRGTATVLSPSAVAAIVGSSPSGSHRISPAPTGLDAPQATTAPTVAVAANTAPAATHIAAPPATAAASKSPRN
jgi:hypothetical protein